MPTGYTSIINGKNATFEQFVWGCARAFGALLHMRDDASGTKIVKQTVSKYHSDELKRAQKRLNELMDMSPGQINVAVKKANTQFKDQYSESVSRLENEKKNYKAMLEKVLDWTPPSEAHKNLKNFMITQINESIEHDCGYIPTIPVEISSEAWHASSIKTAAKDIKYHIEKLEEEQKRIDEANQWIEDLTKSVPIPKKLF